MKTLSKFDIIMITLFVVVLLLGLGGFWYTGTLLEEQTSRMKTENGKLMMINRQRYTPSPKTNEVLQENINKMKATLEPIETKILNPDKDELSAITQMNPVTWKEQKLVKAVNRLAELAAAAQIAVPPTTEGEYFFGFDRYRKSDPPVAATQVLGKQLYGIEQAFKALSRTGKEVRTLVAIRRTYDEDGKLGAEQIGKSPGTTDHLALNVVAPDDGLYEVFPLEFEFTGTPKGLQIFLNNLAKAPVVFAVRSVTATNSNPQSPKLSELEDSMESSGAEQNLIPFGAELVTATVRFDLIDWQGLDNSGEEAAGGNNQQASR